MTTLRLLLLLPYTLAISLSQETAKVWQQPCGTLSAEIFPEQVESYHLPWLARVGYDKQGRMQYDCIGTLIDRQHVLTAAQCVSATQIPARVQLRNCDDKSTRCGGTPRTYGVSTVFTHPEYKSLSTSHDHDIAVLRLDRDVNLSVGGTRAVCLPVDSEPTMQDDSEYVVAGWRIHKNATKYTKGNGPPRTIAVPPVPMDNCQKMYGEAIKLTPDLQLCAGGEGSEPCRGDAGAPLQMLVGRRVFQVGLASYGLPGCSNGSLPTVYTTIKPHIEWIQLAVNSK